MDNASKSRIEVPKFSKSTFLSDVIFEEKKSNVHCPKNKLILLYIKKTEYITAGADAFVLRLCPIVHISGTETMTYSTVYRCICCSRDMLYVMTEIQIIFGDSVCV